MVGELLAARGWTIVARNWRGGGGEIDLVATLDGRVRFVEVKVRAGDDSLSDDAVSPHKRRRLRSAAEAWLSLNAEPAEVCFLVAFVDARVEPWRVRLVDDAF